MGLWQRTVNGVRAFYNAFTDPASQVRDLTREARLDLYSQAWSYYRNLQFSRRTGYDWSVYLAARELYKHTRLIYNPVPMIVDFYVDNIWQPAKNEEVESLVTPLSEKTDEKIVEVVAQLDQWSNFLAEGQKIKRYCAAVGNVLVEGIDDLERGKILHKTIWAGYVTQLELDENGNVQGYTLEYPVYDHKAQHSYTFRKVVTRESYSYFRDDAPFIPEGKTAAVEVNPYGFVFAAWIKHWDDGADYGLPACHSFDKVDNMNSLASHLDDHIHKAIESPKIIGADGEIVPIIGAVQNATTRAITPQDPRLNWVVLKASGGVTVGDLAGAIHLAEAHPYLKDQLMSFTDDYPELQASSIIQKNSQLSGAALERMLGPAQNRLDGVQANYNHQLIKLRQMQIAVAGFRSRGGGWQNLTDQQRLFRDFDLSSYSKGDLNFNLKRSVLVQNTETETEELLKLKAERANLLKPSITPEAMLSIAGFSDDKIAEIKVKEPVIPVIPVGVPEDKQLSA